MRFIRFFTGGVRLEILSPDPEKTLAGLAERGIVLWDAAPVRDCKTEVTVSLRDGRRAERAAQRMGAEIRRVREWGLPAVGRSLRRRPVLAAGLCVCAAVLLAGRAFVWQVEIRGNETVSAGVIRAVLAEQGVDVGRCWIGYSQDLIRNSVLLRIPELRWMTVSMEGCRAVVTVREKRIPPETVQETEYVRIVAEKAGLVTEVRALRGTAEVRENSAVLPGETLIGGYATGRFGVQEAVRAIGGVRARTWYEITVGAPAVTEIKTPLGEKKCLYALQIGKKRINFYGNSSICPVSCDKIIIRRTVSAEGVFTLPVTLEKMMIVPYDTQTQTALELREELEKTAAEELQSRMSPDGEITAADFTFSGDGSMMYVTLRAECCEQIGTEEPLTAADIREIQEKIPDTEE